MVPPTHIVRMRDAYHANLSSGNFFERPVAERRHILTAIRVECCNRAVHERANSAPPSLRHVEAPDANESDRPRGHVGNFYESINRI